VDACHFGRRATSVDQQRRPGDRGAEEERFQRRQVHRAPAGAAGGVDHQLVIRASFNLEPGPERPQPLTGAPEGVPGQEHRVPRRHPSGELHRFQEATRIGFGVAEGHTAAIPVVRDGQRVPPGGGGRGRHGRR
jgi:hypothetical protein